jgi:peptidoglycan/LPS O-acetylase OafA/YrhL
MKTMECLAHGRDNSFNLLRALAAGAVIISHSWPASLGPSGTEPLVASLHFSLGTAAVMVFFALSGFLIAKSFDRRSSVADFAAARVARLFPALAVVTLVTVLVIGPIFTREPLPLYFSDRETIEYIPRTLSLILRRNFLPGLFEDTPYPGVNGSLWTLYYEACCYVGLTFVGLLGFLHPRRYPILLFAYAAVYVAARSGLIPDATTYADLSLPFIAGMTAYIWRRVIPLNLGLLLILCAAAALLQSLDSARQEGWALAFSYGGLWFGGLELKAFRAYNRVGDFSYGLYIYGWPVQQMLASTLPGISPFGMAALALPCALVPAAASWFLVERPALAHRHFLARVFGKRWLRQDPCPAPPVTAADHSAPD